MSPGSRGLPWAGVLCVHSPLVTISHPLEATGMWSPHQHSSPTFGPRDTYFCFWKQQLLRSLVYFKIQGRVKTFVTLDHLPNC